MLRPAPDERDEISGRLDGLSVEELQLVRDYEELNEGRKTLLEQMDRKIRSASSSSSSSS
jgi:hypothetical protein